MALILTAVRSLTTRGLPGDGYTFPTALNHVAREVFVIFYWETFPGTRVPRRLNWEISFEGFIPAVPPLTFRYVLIVGELVTSTEKFCWRVLVEAAIDQMATLYRVVEKL